MEPESERVAAVWLARALNEALNPEAAPQMAMLGRSLLHPLCIKAVQILGSRSIELVDFSADPNEGADALNT